MIVDALLVEETVDALNAGVGFQMCWPLASFWAEDGERTALITMSGSNAPKFVGPEKLDLIRTCAGAIGVNAFYGDNDTVIELLF